MVSRRTNFGEGSEPALDRAANSNKRGGGACQTLSGPLPQSGSPAREARGAAAAAPRQGRNVRQGGATQNNVSPPKLFSAQLQVLVSHHIPHVASLGS